MMSRCSRFKTLVPVVCALVVMNCSAPDPAGNESAGVRLALLTWAEGVVQKNPLQVAAVLHESFPDREDYLDAVERNALGGASYGGITEIVTRHADVSQSPNGVVVSPVVVLREEGTMMAALSLTFVNDGDVWRITSIDDAPGFPEEMIPADLPEHSVRRTVSVSVRDADSGNPIVTRVHVSDRDGNYWPPRGHMKNVPVGWNEHVGADVRLAGKTYAYVDPDFVLSLPDGQFEMELVRGLEYEPRQVRFTVGATELSSITVELERWSDVRLLGWYSGDTHVHFLDPSTALLEMRGEDLNVVNILAAKWGQLITNSEHFIGGPSPLSDPDHIVYVNEETRHGVLGHAVLLNLKELVYPLSWGGPDEGVHGGYDHPPMAHQADQAHRQGGFVSWAHFPWPVGEVAVDIALGKIDALDIMTWGDAFREGERAPARMWYRFLNSGFDLPATAGTDKMFNSQVVGSVRTYVQVEGEFSYDGWLDGIRAGRSFVTTGPILTFHANGHGLGDIIQATAKDTIAVRVEVRSRIPVERVEILRGGEVVAALENEARLRDQVLEFQVAVPSSTWLAARAYSSERLPYNNVPVMAHTSPIYVEVDGRPRRSRKDAAFLAGLVDEILEWSRSEARFQYEEQRAEMIALFEQAKAVYLEQVDD